MKRGQVVLHLPARTIDLTHEGPRVRAQSQIGRTFQTPRLSRELTVWENVLQGTFMAGQQGRPDWRPKGTARVPGDTLGDSLAGDALEMVGLLDSGGAIAGDLAYGDQRRCEIARALASKPMFILMDEPSSGMNDTETREVAGLVRRLAGLGVGIVMVEHDMSLVRAAADEVMALDLGRTICEGSAEFVLSDPVVRGRYLGE
jgi:ABC-type branched-subunit amino acid transport system ATPase component